MRALKWSTEGVLPEDRTYVVWTTTLDAPGEPAICLHPDYEHWPAPVTGTWWPTNYWRILLKPVRVTARETFRGTELEDRVPPSFVDWNSP